MYTPDGHRAWCSAELHTVEKAVDQPLLPVLTVGHRLNNRQEDPGSPNSRGEVDPDGSEFSRGSVRSRIFCFQTLGGCRCWLHPVAPRVLHFLKVLTAWFVCGSDDGGGSLRKAEGADLVDQDSAGSYLDGALFADIQDTLPSFWPGEFNESRTTLNRMDSAAHHAVSEGIHL
ncbi:hypothetical protein T03_17549 [Trichinella britovi]|uniref:Uncharacterized protein n=1 Tax=Trichinella britovi TaxID=45882 RepID=A0A0V1C8J6_TRIBR|nr:hypothetical protein T03_17549 [Trichinella britovi]